MPPTIIHRDEIINTSFEIIRKDGWEAINARHIAKNIGSSTKPIFRIYKNMEALKSDLIDELNKYYNQFMELRISDENYLLTQGIAYIEFARIEGNIFNILFMHNTCIGQSIEEILNAEWNQKTLDNIIAITNCSQKEAKSIFRDVWLYSHGIATQIVANHLNITEKDSKSLMINAFRCFAFFSLKEE